MRYVHKPDRPLFTLDFAEHQRIEGGRYAIINPLSGHGKQVYRV